MIKINGENKYLWLIWEVGRGGGKVGEGLFESTGEDRRGPLERKKIGRFKNLFSCQILWVGNVEVHD